MAPAVLGETRRIANSGRPLTGPALHVKSCDQGKEMVLHTDRAHALEMSLFFRQTASHGSNTNENTNGLLRQWHFLRAVEFTGGDSESFTCPQV